MPHSRSPQTSHGGQTYPEKEKVKAAASEGYRMTKDLETQVCAPPTPVFPWIFLAWGAPAFQVTGAQLLYLVSSREGGQFVSRNMRAVMCLPTGWPTAQQVHTQALTNQGPRGRCVTAVSLLDYFTATGSDKRHGIALFSQHCCHTDLLVALG